MLKMGNKLLLCISGLLLWGVGACTSPQETVDTRRTDFNADWVFRLCDDTAAIHPDYEDADWRKLNLPHDWAIEETSVRTILPVRAAVRCLEALAGIARLLRLTRRMRASGYALILTVST